MTNKKKDMIELTPDNVGAAVSKYLTGITAITGTLEFSLINTMVMLENKEISSKYVWNSNILESLGGSINNSVDNWSAHHNYEITLLHKIDPKEGAIYIQIKYLGNKIIIKGI